MLAAQQIWTRGRANKSQSHGIAAQRFLSGPGGLESLEAEAAQQFSGSRSKRSEISAAATLARAGAHFARASKAVTAASRGFHLAPSTFHLLFSWSKKWWENRSF